VPRGSRQLASFVFGCAIGVAVLEGGVRILGLAPDIAPVVLDTPWGSFESHPNPDLRYVPRPGSPGISSHGLRDHEYAVEKGPGTFRVVVLGDSIGFGMCTGRTLIPVQQTFPKVLEQRLGHPAPGSYTGVEVINLSVSGYDTIQEVEFFREKGLALRPDLVVVGYCLNDSDDASTELFYMRRLEDWPLFDAAASSALETLLPRSGLLRVLWYHLAFRAEATDGPESARTRDRSEAGFERLDALGKREGFETLVVIFPYLTDVRPYPHAAIHDRVRSQAARHGFAVIDLLQPFREAGGGRLDPLVGACGQVHPGPEGHEVAARRIDGVRKLPEAFAAAMCGRGYRRRPRRRSCRRIRR